MPWENVGLAYLVKKKDEPISKAKGIRIYPLKPDGKPDFDQQAMFIFFRDLDLLVETGEPCNVLVPPRKDLMTNEQAQKNQKA